MRFNFRWRRTQRGKGAHEQAEKGKGRRGDSCAEEKDAEGGRRMFRGAELRARSGGLQNRRSAHGEGKTCDRGTRRAHAHPRLHQPERRPGCFCGKSLQTGRPSRAPRVSGPPPLWNLGTGCCGPNSVQTLDDRPYYMNFRSFWSSPKKGAEEWSRCQGACLSSSAAWGQ